MQICSWFNFLKTFCLVFFSLSKYRSPFFFFLRNHWLNFINQISHNRLKEHYGLVVEHPRVSIALLNCICVSCISHLAHIDMHNWLKSNNNCLFLSLLLFFFLIPFYFNIVSWPLIMWPSLDFYQLSANYCFTSIIDRHKLS